MTERRIKGFWARVAKAGVDECWEWTARRDRFGYGSSSAPTGAGQRAAHRNAYEYAIGPIPEGLCVCHTCDNRACCNPAHLFLGSHNDNMKDMAHKQRAVGWPGVSNPSAKLTPAQVIAIYNEAAKGGIQREIAARYGTSQANVSAILRGRKWSAVTGVK